MERKVAARNDRAVGIGLWVLALAGLVLAAGALLAVVREPRALPLAFGLALLALFLRSVFGKLRASFRARVGARSTVANVGLLLAALAVTPLIAFAVLWVSLFVLIGVIWVLHLLGLT